LRGHLCSRSKRARSRSALLIELLNPTARH